MIHRLQNKSYAKINLSLHVYPLDRTGLHPIDSQFQQISLCDQLTVIAKPSQSPSLTLSSSGLSIPLGKGNILFRIFEYLKSSLSHSYDVFIEKHIPLGSGMGGASSNAATFLSSINIIENKNWSKLQLVSLASHFGSDIGFFFYGGRQRVSGTGSIFHPLKQTGQTFYVLIYPMIECSTKRVYAHFDKLMELSSVIPSYPQNANDLMPVVLDLFPEMRSIYSDLSASATNPILLTGSGSTFFIPFLSKEDAIRTKDHLLTSFPNYKIFLVSSLSQQSQPCYQ